ncbi:MAG: FKBP-type peptidyl-prolyl cis-trans isomerase [Flavisolibacter sp.]
MKKYFMAASALLTLAAQAQKKPARTAVPVRKTQTATLKTLNDSVSYAIGMNVAKFYSQQGINHLNATEVARAINDVSGKKTCLLSEEQANLSVMRMLNPTVFKTIEAGERFLAQNKTKPGVKTTTSGLQYEVITEGKGRKPLATDTVEVNYAGTLLDGTEFDNSYKRGAPISFPLNGVIKGWTEALQLMPQGSKYKLYIPYQLAYGMNDNGPIPGGSLLIFEVELLNIKGK